MENTMKNTRVRGYVVCVKSANGYGFVSQPGTTASVFFHYSSLPPDTPFGDVLMEQHVEYTIVESPKGPRAEQIELL